MAQFKKSLIDEMRYMQYCLKLFTLSDKLVMAENEIEDYDLEGRTGGIE